jgi:hypothetical protein
VSGVSEDQGELARPPDRVSRDALDTFLLIEEMRKKSEEIKGKNEARKSQKNGKAREADQEDGPRSISRGKG